MSDVVRNCRHAKEKMRGAITLVFGSIIWSVVILLIGAAIVSGRGITLAPILIYIVAFYLIALLSAALTRAYVFGHDVLLGEHQLPEYHRMVVEAAAALHLPETPYAFLSNSHGLFNAFARRLLGGRYIFLTAALVQAETDAQIRFIIGHELGHHAAGHLDRGKNLLRLPSRFVPLLYPAYSRSRELTCDRIGARLAGDLDSARTALQMLAGGCGRLNGKMDVDAFEAQGAQVPAISNFLLKLVAMHPHTCLRVRELRA